MIAHGNGTHIERRLSRLPRERDLHVIPFFRAVSWGMANISSIGMSSASSSGSASQCRKLYMTSPAPADDRLTTPSSSAPSSSPVVQREWGQIGHIILHCLSGSHQARRHGHAVGNAAEIQHEDAVSRGFVIPSSGVVRHRPDRAVKTFREHDGGCCPRLRHTAGRLPRLPQCRVRSSRPRA